MLLDTTPMASDLSLTAPPAYVCLLVACVDGTVGLLEGKAEELIFACEVPSKSNNVVSQLKTAK